jgi:tRNA nucleotidyltransferase (CCA-adding enzyme)
LKNVDLDIAVEGQGIRLAESFADLHSGAKLTRYPAFKTATVHLPGGRLVDFATARKETYKRGGAFPAVEPSNIKNDLFRRDFTVNAMAISINPETWGKLVDFFKGKRDLSARRLRILHAKSFVDDPTRILRLARFKATLGFSVEAKTLQILKSALRMKVLATIKPQRYFKYFKKVLKERYSREAVRCLKLWGAYHAH